MAVSRVRIKNFRAIQSLDLQLARQTVLIGPNGAGKSTVLRALEKFFSSSASLEPDDYFNSDSALEVSIELTLTGLNDAELERFRSRVHNGALTVARRYGASLGRSSGAYFGLAMRHAAFAAVRKTEGARDKRNMYSELRNSDPAYADLTAVSRGEDVDPALEQWESRNPHLCELTLDDGQFFGFRNVAIGALQKSLSFVLIPAIRDAATDVVDAKGTAISKLMELAVRSVIQKKQEMLDFQLETSRRYQALTNPSSLPELGGLSDALTNALRTYYAEAAVALDWKSPPELQFDLPTASLRLDDEGFIGPVEKKGHGLQRALVLAILQHLATATTRSDSSQTSDMSVEETPSIDGVSESSAPTPSRPSLLLAIEEPELYQHPTKQRHFANVLSRLSESLPINAFGSVQVVFASHSPLFVSIERFDQLRVLRRVRKEPNLPSYCEAKEGSTDSVCARLANAFGVADGTYTHSSLISRLHIISPEVAEAFFSDLAVLVEGASDRAAVLATAANRGISLESKGIAVIPVGGKNNLDKVKAVLDEFSVPTYCIWDNDLGSTDGNHAAQAATNRALQALCGKSPHAIEDFPSGCEEDLAVFGPDLESVLKSELGLLVYETSMARVKDELGFAKDKDALKVPAAVSRFLSIAKSQGKHPAMLERVVTHILAKIPSRASE